MVASCSLIRPSCRWNWSKYAATKSEEVWDAIKQLKVRGAPAIGIAAAYGVVVGLQELDSPNTAPQQDLAAVLQQVVDYLATSRPTAVNLFWALQRMHARAQPLLQQNISALDVRSRFAE